MPRSKANTAADAVVIELTNQFTTTEQSKETLQATHELYTKNIADWNFLLACYEGAEAMNKAGLLWQHERESTKNWERRCKEIYTFNYSRSVIDLFNYYQFKSPIRRQLGTLANQEDWQNFEKDCNRDGDGLDNFMMEQSKMADILGHMGILVDRPKGEFITQADAAGNWPYLCPYLPQNILDWRFERDQSGRRILVYIKLLDDEGHYRLWFQDHWEVWELPQKDAGVDAQPEMIDADRNPLGEIPFVWLYCDKSTEKEIGRSDIVDIAKIDASIMRNLSQAEEIINYAAFPMMRKPFRESGETEQGDDVGVTAVLGFPRDNPEAKPDWLESAVEGPLGAIKEFVMQKIEEIYRASNAGGLAATEIQGQAKSGVALRTEFQLLNGKLIKKSENVVKAERMLLWFWCLWTAQPTVWDTIEVERPRTFEIEDLATDLNNVLTAKTIVISKTFDMELQKMVVRLMLQTADDETIGTIDEEIEEGVEEQQESTYADGLDQYMTDFNLSDEDLAAAEQMPAEEEGVPNA